MCVFGLPTQALCVVARSVPLGGSGIDFSHHLLFHQRRRDFYLASRTHRGAVNADSVNVLATLLVVGVMDEARGQVLGSYNLKQNFAEQLSQVCHHENQSVSPLVAEVIAHLQECFANSWGMCCCPLHACGPLIH